MQYRIPAYTTRETMVYDHCLPCRHYKEFFTPLDVSELLTRLGTAGETLFFSSCEAMMSSAFLACFALYG